MKKIIFSLLAHFDLPEVADGIEFVFKIFVKILC